MQKRYNKYEKYKLYTKLLKENNDGLFNNNEKITSDKNDLHENPKTYVKDEPGVFKSPNSRLTDLYDRLMQKYKPQQLILNNKK
jgi:hypothetical protein